MALHVKEETDIRPSDLELPQMATSARLVVEYTGMQIGGVTNVPESARATDDGDVAVDALRHHWHAIRPWAERHRIRPIAVACLGRKHHRNQRHRRQPQPMRRQRKRRHPHTPAHHRLVPPRITRRRVR